MFTGTSSVKRRVELGKQHINVEANSSIDTYIEQHTEKYL